MKQDLQLQLQAYLDGELSAGECRDVRALLASDAAARDLLTELTHTRAALAAFEATLQVPATREFYWSRIQREISRPAAPAAATPAPFALMAWLHRMLVPAGAFAAVGIAVLLTLPHPSGGGGTFTDASDAVAFTFHNYETGTTLVWLDYPGDTDLSEPDTDDILDL